MSNDCLRPKGAGSASQRPKTKIPQSIRTALGLTLALTACAGQPEQVAEPEAPCTTEEDCYYRAKMNRCLRYKELDDCAIKVYKDLEKERERKERKAQRKKDPETAYFNSSVEKCTKSERYKAGHRKGYYMSERDCQIRVYERIQAKCQENPANMGKICKEAERKSSGQQTEKKEPRPATGRGLELRF